MESRAMPFANTKIARKEKGMAEAMPLEKVLLRDSVSVVKSS
jgi:hypothetical protein